MKRLAFVLAASILATPAAAQTIKQDGRHALVVVDDGFIRLDTESGEVAYCTGEPDRLTCRLAPDERLAYIGEIERLEARIDDLEKRVAQMESVAEPSLDGGDDRFGLPSDEEIDKVMTTTDKIFRRFFGLVRELKKDLEQDRL